MTISARRGNALWRPDLICALALIGIATLIPQDGPRPSVALDCILCGELGGPDLVLNVLLFLPLGVALGRLGTKPFHALGVALALSLAIEGVQMLLPGRSTTLRDSLCNATGAWLGAILAQHAATWVRPSRATAVRLWSAVCAAVLLVAVTGWFAEYAPSETPYYAHWSPRQAHLAHWSGKLARVELDGVSVPFGPVVSPDSVRAHLRDGLTLGIWGTGGEPTKHLGGIFTISDAQKRELLLVGPDGDDLVFRVRRRAADARFLPSEARFPHLLAAIAPGAPLAIRIEATLARTCATVNDVERCIGPPAAGSAWSAVRRYSHLPDAARILLNMLTLGALAFPVGFLLRGVEARQALLAVSILIVGVAVASRGTGLALPTIFEWIGLAAGAVAGLILNRLVTRVGTGAAPAGAT